MITGRKMLIFGYAAVKKEIWKRQHLILAMKDGQELEAEVAQWAESKHPQVRTWETGRSGKINSPLGYSRICVLDENWEIIFKDKCMKMTITKIISLRCNLVQFNLHIKSTQFNVFVLFCLSCCFSIFYRVVQSASQSILE